MRRFHKSKRHYAVWHHRGFANEYVIYSFASENERDKFVKERDTYGHVNCGHTAPRSITRYDIVNRYGKEALDDARDGNLQAYLWSKLTGETL